MAISNLPTWEEGEISSAGKLNQLRDAIETKFSGAIAGGDIAWPLIAQGNLDMNGFSILSVKRFWNIYNAAEYVTFQAAIDAAEATSGGVVVIPPNTEFEVDDQTLEGSNVWIVGSGPTSVLKITSAAVSGQLLATSAGLTDLGFFNMTIDGNTGTGAAQNGLVFKQATRVKIHNVIFDDFSGYPLYFTNDTTNGNSCIDVEVMNCEFRTSDQDHIYADDIDGLLVFNCKSKTSGAAGFSAVPAAAAAIVKNVRFEECDVRSSTDEGLKVIGSAGASSANQVDCHIINSRVHTTTGVTKDGIVMGSTAGWMDQSSVAKCKVFSATGHGISAFGERMDISGNKVYGCALNGIDVEVLEVTVNGNTASDNTVNGIDLEGSSDVVLSGNQMHDNTADGVEMTGVTRIAFQGNVAQGNAVNFDIDTATGLEVGPGNVGYTNSVGFTLLSGETLSVGSGQIDMLATDPQDSVTVKQGGCPFVVRGKQTVLQTSTSPFTLQTVPIGEIWLIKRCYIRTYTAWDGAGMDLDIGISGGDVDGFFDGSAVSFIGAAGVEASDPADQGVLLFSTDILNYVVDATAGAIDIIATITTGGGTAGASKVFLEYTVLKGENEST